VIQVVGFDFTGRLEREISLADVPAARASGRACWIDAEAPSPAELHEMQTALGFSDVIRTRLAGDVDREGFEAHDGAVAVALIEPVVTASVVAAQPIDLVAGEGWLLSVHPAGSACIERVRRAYAADFHAYGRSLGFLFFELGDHLLDGLRRQVRDVVRAVESAQSRLFDNASDDIFQDVARLTARLGTLRAILLDDREALHEIATRRTPFIPETTQPFVARLADSAGRLAGDIDGARQRLHDTLNLYLGMVSHRTNRVVTRLTVLSSIFLPLTFLCGVYGMNFEHMPELGWRYGYAAFWAMTVGIATILFLVMRRARWWD